MDKIETDSDYRQRLIVREEQYCRQVFMPDQAALAIKTFTQSMNLGSGAALDLVGTQARLSTAYPLPRINLGTFVLPENIKKIYTARSDPSKKDLFCYTGKIAAIKLMREQMFMGLKQAKDIIEFIVERDGLLTWEQANPTTSLSLGDVFKRSLGQEDPRDQKAAQFVSDAHLTMHTLTWTQLQEVIDAAMRRQRILFQDALLLQEDTKAKLAASLERMHEDESERSVLKKHLKDV